MAPWLGSNASNDAHVWRTPGFLDSKISKCTCCSTDWAGSPGGCPGRNHSCQPILLGLAYSPKRQIYICMYNYKYINSEVRARTNSVKIICRAF